MSTVLFDEYERDKFYVYIQIETYICKRNSRVNA